jgi:hypothetical protein
MSAKNIEDVISDMLEDTHIDDSSDNESSVILQRRIRELDGALEQCQRGAMAPSITLPTPASLEGVARGTTSAALKSHLDKYNVSQVDQLFNEISLSTLLGSTQEQKEEFANEVNKVVKHWPVEISRQTRLIESSFPGSVESEIEFWKDLERKFSQMKIETICFAQTNSTHRCPREFLSVEKPENSSQRSLERSTMRPMRPTKNKK